MHFPLKLLYQRGVKRASPQKKIWLKVEAIDSECPKSVAIKLRAEGKTRAHRPASKRNLWTYKDFIEISL